jgi:hypothetical protein
MSCETTSNLLIAQMEFFLMFNLNTLLSTYNTFSKQICCGFPKYVEIIVTIHFQKIVKCFIYIYMYMIICYISNVNSEPILN